MSSRIPLWVAIWAWAVPGTATAATDLAALQACAPVIGETAEVATVAQPLLLGLASGTRLRLEGLGLAPTLEAGERDGFLEASLRTLADGQAVRVHAAAKAEDRHGNALAQVVVQGPSGDVWLQAELVRSGAALVDSWAGNAACAPALLAIEAEARAARRGLWADPANLPIPAEEAGRALGRFALIEGRVLAAENVRGRIYLNFGADWREDFTLRLEPEAVRGFKKNGIDLLAYAGEFVRVRGYVSLRNGPEIEVTHPEQIESGSPAPALLGTN